MKTIINPWICIIFLCLFSTSASAAELTGLWQEYNDDSEKLEALIRIEKLTDNSYAGKIEKLLPESAGNSALICTDCPGDFRDRPLTGLRILSGLKRKNRRTFEGGEILDPDDGKLYQCSIRLSEDGNTIEVTGYLSFNWIGHSEIWRRSK